MFSLDLLVFAGSSTGLTSFQDLWKDMESVQMRDKDRSCPKEQVLNLPRLIVCGV